MLTPILFLSTAFAGETARLYTYGGGSVGIPVGVAGIAYGGYGGIGFEFPSHVAVGMRMLVEPNPPSLFDRATPKLGVGPVVDIAAYYPASPVAELYPKAGFGFIAGVSEVDGTNIVLPIIEGGFGIRVHPDPAGGLYVAPEVGVVDFMIPYVGLNVGFLAPESN